MAKKQTPRKQKLSTKALETQAEQIINDPNKYDADTRNAIGIALSDLAFSRTDTSIRDVPTAERELRTLVSKAEAGEYVFDVEGIGAEYVEAARTIYDVITESNHIPHFIYDAVTVALNEAQQRTGCQH
jgi:hypothetical protein